MKLQRIRGPPVDVFSGESSYYQASWMYKHIHKS